mmetsp:Transcript_18514/g.45882  ORF Transcript_18514/g.45882 Transcript_18514/m.45882 type:complete len:117 (-) Transcript_18514:1363-1713(-)
MDMTTEELWSAQMMVLEMESPALWHFVQIDSSFEATNQSFSGSKSGFYRRQRISWSFAVMSGRISIQWPPADWKSVAAYQVFKSNPFRNQSKSGFHSHKDGIFICSQHCRLLTDWI